MQDFDKTWFRSLEEKQQSAEKARAILEQTGMREEDIIDFLNNDELIWTVCDDPARVLAWNDEFPDVPLSTSRGARILAQIFID